MMARHRMAVVVLSLGVAALAGCRSEAPLAEVEGRVLLDGKPLEKVAVEFWPEGDGLRSIGMTDAEGRYTLTTDDGERSGASIGAHRVVLHDVSIMNDQFLGRAGEDVDVTGGKKPRIAASYGDPTQTPLHKQVSPDKNVIDLEVTAPRASYRGR